MRGTRRASPRACSSESQACGCLHGNYRPCALPHLPATRPRSAKTLYVLLADLYDTSPNTNRFVKKMEFLLESRVKAIALLAISDQGKGRSRVGTTNLTW